MTDEIQTALRDMAREIGALSSTVSGLVTQWRDQDEKASNGRAVLHTKLDGLREDFNQWRSRIDKLEQAIDEMKPVVDDVKRARERAIGAFWMTRMFYAIGIALTAGTTWVFSNWIKISIR